MVFCSASSVLLRLNGGVRRTTCSSRLQLRSDTQTTADPVLIETPME